MTSRGWLGLVTIAAAGTLGTWLIIVTLPNVYEERNEAGAPPPVDTAAAPVRMTAATLFYVSNDGERLVGIEHEVAVAEIAAERIRHVLEAQFQPVDPPLVSAVPAGTALRALYMTDRGDAFVDVSRDISSGHSGGSLDELLTIYTIVNAVTVNVPDVRAVQILIEGREADTLAGHVDLRRPLTLRAEWTGSAPASGPGTPAAP